MKASTATDRVDPTGILDQMESERPSGVPRGWVLLGHLHGFVIQMLLKHMPLLLVDATTGSHVVYVHRSNRSKALRWIKENTRPAQASENEESNS